MSNRADPDTLTPLERAAFRHAIESIRDPEHRAALLRQFDALRVREREYTGVGVICDCECAPDLRSAEIPDTGDGELPVLDLFHPNGRISLQFIVRTEDGAIARLDAMSLDAPWSEEEVTAGAWPEAGGPIELAPRDDTPTTLDH